MLALLDHLARIVRLARLNGVMLLTVLCIGLAAGALIDQRVPVGCVAAVSSAGASMELPAPSCALERAAAGLSESIQVSDAQDDPAPALAGATDQRGRHQQFRALPAIAFTSTPPSRHERPPIRSFLQS